MLDDTEMSALLTQLSSIAHAAMTADEREKRAQPVLTGAGATVEDVCAAVHQADVSWNQAKARAYGLPIGTWLEATEIACTPRPQTLRELLDSLHKAESTVWMLKAGYRAHRDEFGRLSWTPPRGADA